MCWRLGSVSVFRWNLLRWAQQKELVCVSELVPKQGPPEDGDNPTHDKSRLNNSQGDGCCLEL
jgi:hypothetical protein